MPNSELFGKSQPPETIYDSSTYLNFKQPDSAPEAFRHLQEKALTAEQWYV